MSRHALTCDRGFFGNIFVREMIFESAGDVHPGHRHNHDHVMLIGRGAVEINGRPYRSPGFVEIPRAMTHDIIALVDDTIAWCLFAMRDVHGLVTDRLEDRDPTENPYGHASEVRDALG